jgi:hypothetical protein
MGKVRQLLLAIFIGAWGLITIDILKPTMLYHMDTVSHVSVIKLGDKPIDYTDYATMDELQKAINRDPSTAGTCPFQVAQDNHDGKSSYFAGHDKDYFGGCFESLKMMNIGDAISVTDRTGSTRTYRITDMFIGADNTRTWTPAQFNMVFQTPGEQIVLQTCVSETHNLIVIAK